MNNDNVAVVVWFAKSSAYNHFFNGEHYVSSEGSEKSIILNSVGTDTRNTEDQESNLIATFVPPPSTKKAI